MMRIKALARVIWDRQRVELCRTFRHSLALESSTEFDRFDSVRVESNICSTN